MPSCPILSCRTDNVMPGPSSSCLSTCLARRRISCLTAIDDGDQEGSVKVRDPISHSCDSRPCQLRCDRGRFGSCWLCSCLSPGQSAVQSARPRCSGTRSMPGCVSQVLGIERMGSVMPPQLPCNALTFHHAPHYYALLHRSLTLWKRMETDLDKVIFPDHLLFFQAPSPISGAAVGDGKPLLWHAIRCYL